MDKNIIYLTLAFSILFFGFSAIMQYSTTYFSYLGITYVGFISLILIYLALSLSSVFSFVVVNRLGLKNSMMFASVFYFLGGLGLVLGNVTFIYISSILNGIAGGMLWNSYSCYLLRASKINEYGKNSGFIGSIRSFFNPAGIFIAGILITVLPIRTTFVILMALASLSIVFFSKLKDFNEKIKFDFKELGKTFTDIKLLRISTIWISLSTINGLSIALIPLSILGILGKNFLWLMVIFYVIPIPLSFYIGKISDMLGRPKMIIILFILMIVGMFALYVADSIVLILIGIAILGVVSSASSVISTPLIGDLACKNNLRYFSSLSWFSTSMGFVVSLILGLLVRSNVTYLICIAISILTLAIAIPALKKYS
jgi:MFS family permease